MASPETIAIVKQLALSISMLRKQTFEVMDQCRKRTPKGKDFRRDPEYLNHMGSISHVSQALQQQLTCPEDQPYSQATPIELWMGDELLTYMHGTPAYDLELMMMGGMYGVIYDHRLRLDFNRLFKESMSESH